VDTEFLRRGFKIWTAEAGPLWGVPGASCPQKSLKYFKLRSLEMGFPAFFGQVSFSTLGGLVESPNPLRSTPNYMAYRRR